MRLIQHVRLRKAHLIRSPKFFFFSVAKRGVMVHYHFLNVYLLFISTIPEIKHEQSVQGRLGKDILV